MGLTRLGLSEDNLDAALDALYEAGVRYKENGAWDFREIKSPDLRRYRAAYEALLPMFGELKPLTLKCHFTVRLASGEEARIRKLATQRGLTPHVYCRVAGLCKSPFKRVQGLATGKYYKIHLGVHDKLNVEKSARRANMRVEHYLRCRILTGFEPRDLFDGNGAFKLWRISDDPVRG